MSLKRVLYDRETASAGAPSPLKPKPAPFIVLDGLAPRCMDKETGAVSSPLPPSRGIFPPSSKSTASQTSPNLGLVMEEPTFCCNPSSTLNQ